MAEEIKPTVDPTNTQEKVGEGEVITPVQENKGDIDFAKSISEKDAKIAQLTKERDDFHKGMNLWRTRARQNTDSELQETDDEKIARIAEEKAKEIILQTELAKANSEKEELIKKMATENAELKLALKNKAVTTTSQGSNLDKGEIKPEFFSKEQLEELKKRFPNADPNKVIENLKRLKDNKT